MPPLKNLYDPKTGALPESTYLVFMTLSHVPRVTHVAQFQILLVDSFYQL